MPTEITVPCACGCTAEVSIDGLGSALFVSHEGEKLFCASHACVRNLQSKIEGGQFLSTFKDLVCSHEGEAHMEATAALFDAGNKATQ